MDGYWVDLCNSAIMQMYNQKIGLFYNDCMLSQKLRISINLKLKSEQMKKIHIFM